MHMIVTGATGFIGRAVVQAALQQGHAVTAVVRDAAKVKMTLPDDGRLCVLPVRDLSDAEQQLKPLGEEALIHLAWGDVGKYTDPSNLLDNLEPQFLFLQAMLAAGIRNITVAGTCLEYGLQEGAVREEDCVSPVTFYGLAKKTLHDMLVLAMPADVSLKWLRYFYVYGEGQRPQAIIPQLRAAMARGDSSFDMSPGDQSRDFIHVETAAWNTVLAAAQTVVTGIVNMGSGRAVQVAALVEKILSAENYRMSLRKGVYGYPAYEPFAFWADISKMAKIQGVRVDEEIRV